MKIQLVTAILWLILLILNLIAWVQGIIPSHLMVILPLACLVMNSFYDYKRDRDNFQSEQDEDMEER